MSFSFANYKIDSDTDKQSGGGGYTVLPYGNYRVWVESLDFPETDDKKGYQAALIFEVQEPEEFKGKTWREWWTCLHSDEYKHGKYKFGKPRYDKLCRATGVGEPNADTKTEDFTFKSFVVTLGTNSYTTKDGVEKTNNQIEHFFYEDDDAIEPLPELGVIGDGTQPARGGTTTKAPANDNKPAAQPAAAAAGDRPWPKPGTAGGAGSNWGQKKAA